MYHTSRILALAFVLLLPALATAQITNCTQLPPHNATTITDLRPGDVQIIMAMGDSITTAFGVRASANESYGVSFSIGGDPGAISLANFFLDFNPDLVGYSTGTYPAQVCYGSNCATTYFPSQSVNNAAKSGAMVADMVSTQVTYLITQVNQAANMDVANGWKVLTIMIGANDLCASCTFGLDYLAPDDYQNNLMATLERVRTSLPRTFVNLVGGFNISQAYELSLQTSRCNNISRPWFIQCDCLFQPDNGFVRATIDSSIALFNQRAQAVATYYQRQAYSNFAVVFQPFAINTYISELPTSFLSHLDCFHPSTTGQQAMAVALWNNMLTPSALKKTYMEMSDTPICPTPTTLLYTY